MFTTAIGNLCSTPTRERGLPVWEGPYFWESAARRARRLRLFIAPHLTMAHVHDGRFVLRWQFSQLSLCRLMGTLLFFSFALYPFFSLLHMYIFRENKHYRAYRHLSNFSPCNSFFLMSGWMSSYTLHMCLLPWLRTVKGRGGRHNGAGLLLLLHSVERKSTSNTNGWMDYYKSKSSLIAIENDFILHLHLLKYFFCIFNSVFFFYISIDPLRRLPAISSFCVVDLRGWKV